MVRGDSVTISFRLNLNREEDTEIWNFLTGDALEACFGDKSKCIKSAMIKMIQGIKQDESEKHLVCEMNAQRETIQNAMSGEADRIINAVKLIVEEQVKGLAVMQTDNLISHEISQTTLGESEETSKVSEESLEILDDDIADYAMSFLT